jgi:4-amino-4-deoxy-L-arabinose transferase-like glycosyltransferase
MAKLSTGQIVRWSLVVGLGLLVALWIAFAQIGVFPSMLNKCAVTHPWLLQNGFVDYQHLPGQKSPLLPLFLSWLSPLFHHDAALSARITHAFFICLIVLISLLWAYRYAGRWAFVVTAIFMLTWSNFFGLWAIMYYDVALAPLYLLAFILTVQQMEKPAPWKMGALGLTTGLAILTKQHALLLTLPISALLIWQLVKGRLAVRQIIGFGLVYLIGLSLPLVIYGWSYYRQAGSFKDLVYWTLIVNLAGPFGSESTLAPQPEHLRDMLPALLMVIPFVGSIFFGSAGMKPARGVRILLLAMLFIGLFLLYPRYSTRHWPPAFPFLALLSGIACADLIRDWKRFKAPSLILITASIVLCWIAIAVLIYVPRLENPRFFRSSEYNDLIDVADQLRERIPAEGRVVLLPLDEGNANLSYLLGRLPQRYWLFNYRWFMNPTTIQRWLEVMEEEKPNTLLFFPEGIDLTTSAPEILDYVNENYVVTDTVKWGNRRQIHIMLRSPNSSP